MKAAAIFTKYNITAALVLLLTLLTVNPGIARSRRVRAEGGNIELGSVMSAEELPDGSILVADGGGADKTLHGARIIIIDKKNRVVWRYDEHLAFPHSARLLPDGSIGIADSVHNRVFAVDRKTKKILWTSDDWSGGTGKLSDGTHLYYPNYLEGYPDGNLLVSDDMNNRIVIVDRNGNIRYSYGDLHDPHSAHILGSSRVIVAEPGINSASFIDTGSGGAMPLFADIGLNLAKDFWPLPGGHILIADTNNNRVVEVDPNGQMVWEYAKELEYPQSAIRLRNGDTLIVDSFNYRLLEVTPGKEIVRAIGGTFDPPYQDRLVNGGFEKQNSDGSLAGWLPGTLFSSGNEKISVDSAVRHSGRQSARLDFSGKQQVFITQFIRVKAGKTYLFSGWMKTNMVASALRETNGARFEFYWMDRYGRDLPKVYGFSRFLQNTNDWTKLEFPLTAPSGAVGVRLQATSYSDGTVWVDDVSLTEANWWTSWFRWEYLALFLCGAVIMAAAGSMMKKDLLRLKH